MKTTEFQNLLFDLSRTMVVLDRSEKVCCGLTASQGIVVERISREGAITMNSLSGKLGLAVSSLTRVLDILVRDGVIGRVQSEQDRRKVLVSLTGKGKLLAGQLNSCTADYCKAILKNIPAGDRDNVIHSLSLILKAVNKANKGCCR